VYAVIRTDELFTAFSHKIVKTIKKINIFQCAKEHGSLCAAAELVGRRMARY